MANDLLLPSSPTVAERILALQAEAKSLGASQITALITRLRELEWLAAEIKDGGEAYVPGVRDIARQIAEDCDSRVQTIEAIVARTA